MKIFSRSQFFLQFFVIFLFIISPIFSQIVFKELPQYEINTGDLGYLGKSSVRNIILLNGHWKVYNNDDKEKKKTTVNVPSVNNSNNDLVFEKTFNLTGEQIKNNNLELHFLGLNYSAEISLNNKLIYRHTGGEYPFSCVMPRDWLYGNKENVISIIISSKLDDQTTIPFKHTFLYPENLGGIFRDVFIEIIPNINIAGLSVLYNFPSGFSKVKVEVNAKVVNNEYSLSNDSISKGDVFDIKFSVQNKLEISSSTSASTTFQLKKGKEKIVNQSLEVANPVLWSPSSPFSYNVVVQIYRTGALVDEIIIPISFYQLNPSKNSITLNGNNFQLNGVTYIPSNYNYGSMLSYDDMRRDIKMIKELGFNSVRFSKSVPHPYLLSLCEEYGLLAFIDLPLSSVPSSFLINNIFIDRCKNYLNKFLIAYGNYSSVAAIGLGSSYIGKSDEAVYFLNEISAEVKKYTSKLVYASFCNLDFTNVPKLDFFGFEIFDKPVYQIDEYYKKSVDDLGRGKVFISEAGYIDNLGVSNGSTNPHTHESQAKFFEELLSYCEQDSTSGYFINTIFDYRTNYNSIVSGYNNEGKVLLGILGEDRNTDRISYKIIYSKLHNFEKVTIPLGIKKDDSPMIFILFGLAIALSMGFLINTGRRFREDASRALLRPYNFFADIRDLRVISGVQTTLLAVIVSTLLALTVESIMYNLKTEPFFEKMVLALGSHHLLNIISYLTWHPTQALLILTFIFMMKILFISLLIKIFSFFVMNKVFLSNAYYTTIWSFLPVVLTIPLAIVLYRLISGNIFNFYIYVVLIVFIFWILYRLLKGIHVIYDVAPGKVYFYSFFVIVIAISILLFYFHTKNSAIDYISQALKEYKAQI